MAKVIVPRPYQREAAWATQRCWGNGLDCVVGLPTGSGKTAVAGLLAGEVSREKRFLVLVNRVELVRQFVRTLRSMLPDDTVEVEIGGKVATHPDGQMTLFGQSGRIVVASKDTLYDWRRLQRWRPEEVGHIVVDECHLVSPRNKSYARILQYFPDARKVGLSATLWRNDGVSLGCYFQGGVVYNYELLQAIRDGWLVPVVQHFEETEGWDLLGVPRGAGGDFLPEPLEERLRRKRPLYAVASAAEKWGNHLGRRRKTLVFCAGVGHAEDVAKILNEAQPGCARSLHGGSPADERKAVLEAYGRGEFQYLCGCALFDVGYDDPSIEVVVMGAMTYSAIKYVQRIGRGTRPLEEIVAALNAASSAEERRWIIRSSLKPCVYVVDVAGVSSEHKLINSIDVLGGFYPPKVREEAVHLIRNSPVPVPVDEALKKARELARKKEDDRRQGLIYRARLLSREVDPFCVLDLRPKRVPLRLRGKPATDPQVAFLQKNNVPAPTDLGFWQAKQLIEEVIRRKETEPPTEKQAAVLRRYGFDTTTMTFKEARAALDLLQISGWPLPQGM